MTDQQHPITPLPELIEEWIELSRPSAVGYADPNKLATLAARWGADQELEACCECLIDWDWDEGWSDKLRAARRSKPPSLKALALAALNEADQGLNESEWQQRSDTIRRALEALDD